MRLLLTFILLFQATITTAETYLSQQRFLEQTFADDVPKAKLFWVGKAVRSKAEAILNHRVGFLRTRYWQRSDRVAWVLEEVGKVEPITVGIVIVKDRIESLQVLVFRESRGWEVKHDFFARQYIGGSIADDLSLNGTIDGISGATLSVRAVTKLARLALLFNNSK